MTSSMLTGERRYASTRRGGMTILGKVAVPKPINLPSQRLENHGLDPSVEIVPKGTYSWGSKSSSSAPNAWGSSILSPNTDGGSGSPSHLSGRPSSGSGTRPSTANSDKTHEPIANAWGSNSRPSSASGVLTSNQTSLASLRPRSAETRPGSSQLSRFADPLSDNSVAWSATGTAEKLGVGSSKNNGFSLTSGDFPTLGSEKENSGKNMESQDGSHSRPGSSSGCIAPGKERDGNSAGDASIATNAKIESTNSWRREDPMYGEDGPRPSIEKWHPDTQPYPNSNFHPQNYDAWRGPPVNNHPGGAWYRGPSGGPHFVPPVPPGGFPMEPFPYYRPQQGPPPGPLPRGPRPTNGDIYRPHMHDAYIRPGMPFGPGFYPGPVPYEGYYRPPVGYCNSAEREIPFMGMAVGPANYNRYSGQIAHDTGNSHGRSGGYCPGGKPKVSEQVESGHPQDARGPYKVLLKQHDGSGGIDEEQRWDDTVTANASCPGKVDHRGKSSWENDWRAEDQDAEGRNARRMPVGEVSSSEATDNRGGVKSLECVGNLKAADYSSVNKLEHAGHGASAFPEFSGPSKDPSLIKKIEGLNAKSRASDGRQDVKFVSSREEQKNKLQVGNAKSNHAANETNTFVSHERTHASGIIDTVSHEDLISDEDKSLEAIDASGRASSRRLTHGVHTRGDHRGKGRFNNQEADGWRKRSQAMDMPSILSSSHFESSDVHRQDHTFSEAIEKSGSYQVKDDGDGESMPPHTDLGDSQMQRAKMKELAIQRIKQREKEEEERTRDQKAKAFAKLEELNKRSVIQKSETAPSSAIQNKQEEPSTLAQSTGVASKSSAPSLALGSNPNGVAESSTIAAENSISLSSEVLPEIPKATHEEPIAVHDQMKPLQWDASLADAAYHNNASQINDSRTSKQKHVSYRQKQNSPLEKASNEKLTPSPVQEPKSANDVAADAPGSVGGANEIALNAESSLPINPAVMVDSSVHQKRKSRTGKNKHKAEEASSATVVPALVSKETTVLDTSVERGKSSESVLDRRKFQSQTDSRDGNQLLDQCTSSPNEEAHGKMANQWKPQHSRKMQRNPQANKSTEKFQSGDAVIWAPVRSQNKIEFIDEGREETVADAISPPMKSDQQMQSNPRNKRAEMERYIPKPVAKEMAQQGSSHQSVAPLVDHITPEETVARPESDSPGAENSQTSAVGMGKVGSVMESRNGDDRHGKLGKPHGSWRQRSAVESTTSSTARSVQKSIEHHQAQKPDVSIVKEQSSHSEEWNASDGWNIPENSDVPTAAPSVKDQGTTAKGRRHTYKGQKGTGYNHDPDEKRMNSADTEKVYASEIHQSDLPAASKENRAVGDRSTSHWQPKSQPFSATNQRGRTNGGQNVSAEVGRSNKKGSTSQSDMQALPQSDKETTVVKAEARPDHALSEKSNLEEVTSTGHQEGRKERKISHKGHPSNPVESSSSNMDFRHEQCGPSGFRKNGNQNSRFGREQDSHGDWNGSSKDNKQHSVPANRERQRHNSHYEYQPVGPQNNNRTNHFESAKDGSHTSSARPRERGQSHPRRGGGNFYGRQTGSVRVETSYD